MLLIFLDHKAQFLCTCFFLSSLIYIMHWKSVEGVHNLTGGRDKGHQGGEGGEVVGDLWGDGNDDGDSGEGGGGGGVEKEIGRERKELGRGVWRVHCMFQFNETINVVIM